MIINPQDVPHHWYQWVILAAALAGGGMGIYEMIRFAKNKAGTSSK